MPASLHVDEVQVLSSREQSPEIGQLGFSYVFPQNAMVILSLIKTGKKFDTIAAMFAFYGPLTS